MGHFKEQTGDTANEKTWTWQQMCNLKRKTESLLIAAQYNAIRTNYVIVKIDNTPQIWLYDGKDETSNPIVSKCSKLAQ